MDGVKYPYKYNLINKDIILYMHMLKFKLKIFHLFIFQRVNF
jgi:hypothetical protein